MDVSELTLGGSIVLNGSGSVKVIKSYTAVLMSGLREQLYQRLHRLREISGTEDDTILEALVSPDDDISVTEVWATVLETVPSWNTPSCSCWMTSRKGRRLWLYFPPHESEYSQLQSGATSPPFNCVSLEVQLGKGLESWSSSIFYPSTSQNQLTLSSKYECTNKTMII